MNTINFTKKQAKDFIVNYHFINTKSTPSIKEVFSRLQCIQYDPLNVVGTNSELVLQSRSRKFHKEDLYNALYKERLLIDGWDKMMGIYQTIDYPAMHPQRMHRAELAINTLKHRTQIEALDYVEEITNILKVDGPKYSSEIKIGESKKHRWGNTKPSSATLDYLFHKGAVGIKERRNTQKKYALIETLIDNHNTPAPHSTEEEFIEYFLLRRIKSMGLVWNKSGVHFSGIHINSKVTRNKYLKILVDKKLISVVKIEDIDELFYVPTEALDIPLEIEDQISFIAPLDNLIWDRDLIELLFNYQYRWEVYTPIIKRKYGYYVLPILRGSDFIGRIEFEQQRRTDPLLIKSIWLEEGVKPNKTLYNKIEKALVQFAKYLNTNYTKETLQL